MAEGNRLEPIGVTRGQPGTRGLTEVADLGRGRLPSLTELAKTVPAPYVCKHTCFIDRFPRLQPIACLLDIPEQASSLLKPAPRIIRRYWAGNHIYKWLYLHPPASLVMGINGAND